MPKLPDLVKLKIFHDLIMDIYLLDSSAITTKMRF